MSHCLLQISQVWVLNTMIAVNKETDFCQEKQGVMSDESKSDEFKEERESEQERGGGRKRARVMAKMLLFKFILVL